MTTALTIANYFIKKSQEDGLDMTPMKLLKLCYIAHGWYLAIFKKELIDEVIYAWKYGPVIETLYHEFKHYGNNQITRLYVNPFQTDSYPLPQDKDLIDFLDLIWASYGNYNGVQLSSMTHQEGTPWYTIWEIEKGKNMHNAPIPNSLIRKHYENLLNERVLQTN